MTENNEEKLNLRGYFIGKEFVKAGKAASGKDWKMYKLLVKENMEQQYPKKFTMFEGLKGFDGISEGDYVNVGYVLSDPFEITLGDGMKKTIQSKKAIWISKSDANQQQTIQQSAAPTKPKIDIDKFLDMYDEKASPEDRNINHCIGTFVRTHFPEDVKEVIDKYNDKFNEVKEEIVQ